jgi:5,10-methylene-tetrahydrofolate dehydrogenase/methenyl tetrahydrofolate cyclohydrolase
VTFYFGRLLTHGRLKNNVLVTPYIGTDLPEDVSQEELLKVVAQYNADPKVNICYVCVALTTV